jgi:hypothetical protein
VTFPRIFLAVLLLGATAMVAQTRDSSGRTPESVVQRFCTLDQQGALLDDAGLQRVRPLLLWVPTTKWLNLYVVRGSRIVDHKVEGSHDATVTVEYERLGRIKNGKFEPDRGIRRSVYDLQLSDQEWQMENGEPVLKESEPQWRLRHQTQPHLSPALAVKYLQQLQTEAPDEQTRAELQTQIQAIEDAERIATLTPLSSGPVAQLAKPAGK